MSSAEINVASNQFISSLADGNERISAGLPVPYPFPARSAEGFINTVLPLEQIIDLETKSLQSLKPITLQDFNHKKIYGLLELMRTLPVHEVNTPTPEMEVVLSRLRNTLDKNLSILHMHLTAIREISATIANAIQEHESDGTYTGQMNVSGAPR